MKGKSNFKRLTAKQQVRQLEMKRCQQQLAGAAFSDTLVFN
jgi:hypothetical protein